ncbi:MAG TPA: DUF488 family protein [Pseudonocardiaceae bacterium]|nr:DUF488 family protein [Pseudonocardiaceae bacterium]
MTARTIAITRVYDLAEADGDLVLVDRVWPRGMSKEKLAGVTWFKDVAPSADLRKWYGHDPAKFTEFAKRYRAELGTEEGQQALHELAEHGSAKTLTLLTATKDIEHSQAEVLAEELRRLGKPQAADLGGDPVCWLTSVCPECGRFVEAEPPTRCPRCGAEINPD